MCYTIKIEQTREALEKRFGARFTEPEKYRPGRKVNAFTLPLLPVICSDNPENISLFYWGLIPRWVKNMDYAQDIRIKTFNARSESIAEKASFRHLYRRNHCLVLVDGFYEWQHNDKTKVAYLIGLKDQESFALAGLYDIWNDLETGEIYKTFTVITTNANPMMEVIHNTKKRMPVIVDPSSEKNWLDTGNSANDFFVPFPDNNMFAKKL